MTVIRNDRTADMKRRVSFALLWSTAGSWSREGVNFLVFLILARLLGPETYGLVGMAMVLAAFTQIMLVEGIPLVLIQRKNIEAEHIDTVFWLLIVLGTLSSVAMVACAPSLAAFYGEPEVERLLYWIALLPIIQALASVYAILLRRDLQFNIITMRSMLAAVIGGIVGVTMAVQGYGAISLVTMFICQWLIQLIVMALKSPWQPGFGVSLRHFREVREYMAESICTRFLGFLEQQAPRVIIGSLMGPATLGLFTMGWRLLEVLTSLVIMPVSQVAMPTFSRLQDDPVRVDAMLRTMVQLAALVGFPSFIGLSVTAPELVPMVFGSKWSEAVPVVQIMAVMGISWSITFCANGMLAGMGVRRWRLCLGIINLVMLVGVLGLGSIYGMIILALALVGRTLVILPLTLLVLRRTIGINIPRLLTGLFPILAAALAMAIAVAGVRAGLHGHPQAIVLLASVTAGVTVYPVLLLLFARSMTRKMIQSVSSMWSLRHARA